MTIRGTLGIAELVKDLRDAGYTVVAVNKRYRVSHPGGGDAVFIPQSLPKNARATTVADVERQLKAIGWDPAQAEEARERDRQQRLAQARKEEEAALARAKAEAASRPAPAEMQEVIRQRISPEASTSAPEPTEPRSEIMVLDANFAAELLKHNRFYDRSGKLDPEAASQRTNRPFSQARAEKYRDDILRGEWKLTHQGIALDRDGLLIDGQHRLVGLILAAEKQPGITIRTMVTYDLEPEAFDAVDIGTKRTVGDVLASHGEKSALHLSAAARLVIFYDSKRPPNEWAHAQVTPEQALDLVRREPELREAVRWGTNHPLALPAAECASRHVILRACEETGRRFAREFFDAYRSGAGLSVADPALTLRNLILAQAADRKRKRSGLEQFSLIIKAWNAEAAGKKQKVLGWRHTEGVPRAIGLR